MLKLAVIGAQTLLGRELSGALDTQDCSVLPLSTGVLTVEEEDGDLVVFAPSAELMEGLDVCILTDTPHDLAMMDAFAGRILDLRPQPHDGLEPMPLTGAWQEGVKAYRGRPALDQVIALLPQLLEGFGEVSGTYLRAVGHLGDHGLDGLMEQTLAVLQGNDPEKDKLNYRAAFEVIPHAPRGRLVEVDVPVFHGDILILHLNAASGEKLIRKEAPQGVMWVDTPPTSRQVAVTPELLAYLSLGNEDRSATLMLGFDPILWGMLRPALKVLGFSS